MTIVNVGDHVYCRLKVDTQSIGWRSIGQVLTNMWQIHRPTVSWVSVEYQLRVGWVSVNISTNTRLILNRCLTDTSLILNRHWTSTVGQYISCVSAEYQPILGQNIECWNVSHYLCQLSVGLVTTDIFHRYSTDTWLTLDCLPTNSQLTLDRLFTDSLYIGHV